MRVEVVSKEFYSKHDRDSFQLLFMHKNNSLNTSWAPRKPTLADRLWKASLFWLSVSLLYIFWIWGLNIAWYICIWRIRVRHFALGPTLAFYIKIFPRSLGGDAYNPNYQKYYLQTKNSFKMKYKCFLLIKKNTPELHLWSTHSCMQ